MKATETEIALAQLIDNYEFKRKKLTHQIDTATKLGYQVEVLHLRSIREEVENFGYALKDISEKYEKERAATI